MRPDLADNTNSAKQILRRSSITDIRTLAAVMPDLSPATIFVANFKAGDARRTEHTHIFIPEASSVARDFIAGSAPSLEKTKAFLETGWGEVEELTINFWGGASGTH